MLKKLLVLSTIIALVLVIFAGLSMTQVNAPEIVSKEFTTGSRGGSVNYNLSFTVDPGWDHTKLFAAAWVQDSSWQAGAPKTSEVLNAYMDPLDDQVHTTGTDRYVLFELITGTWCGYCPAADGSFHRIVNDATYFPAKCVPITWHGSDAYETTDGRARIDEIAPSGYPTATFDNKLSSVGGGTDPDSTAKDATYKNNIDTRRAVSPDIKITTKGHVTSSNGWINVTVDIINPPTITDTNVYVYLVEDLDTSYSHGGHDVPLRHTGHKKLLKQGLDLSNSPPDVAFNENPAGKTYSEQATITWTATDFEDVNDAAMSVELLYQKGDDDFVSIGSTTNTGSYNWDCSALEDGNDYKLKLEVKDSANMAGSVTSGTFTIDNPDPPEALLTFPTQTETVMGNVTITWDSSDPESPRGELKASLYYTTNSVDFTTIVEDIVDTGSYVWDTSGLEDGTNYKVKVKIEDPTGLTVESVSRNTFTIDNMDNPLITLDTDLDGKELSGEVLVKWTAQDDEDSHLEMEYSLYLSSDSGLTWDAVFELEDYMSTYKLDTTQYENGDYLLKVEVTDTSGLKGYDVTNSPFTIYNNEAPSVTLSSPKEGETYEGTISIEYAATDNQDAIEDLKVSIYYSQDLDVWEQILDKEAASDKYDWDVSKMDSGEYFVKVEVFDSADASVSVVSGLFEIQKNDPPEITSMFPAGGETLPTKFTITWRASDPNGDDLKVTIESQTCVDDICGLFESIATDLDNTGSYTITSDLAPGEYNFRIIITEDKIDGLSVNMLTKSYVHIKEDAEPVDPPADDDDDDDDDEVVDPVEDSDEDGLKDTWEMEFFGDLVTADDTTDSDGDGVLDIAEQTADTDPTDDSSFPEDVVKKDDTQDKSSSSLAAIILIAVVVLIGIIVVIVVLVVMKPKKKEPAGSDAITPEAESDQVFQEHNAQQYMDQQPKAEPYAPQAQAGPAPQAQAGPAPQAQAGPAAQAQAGPAPQQGGISPPPAAPQLPPGPQS